MGATVDARQGGTNIASVFTDSDGCYRLENLDRGTYSVVPSFTGCTFSPTSLTVSNPPTSGRNFTATGPTAAPSISSVTANPATVANPTGSSLLAALAAGNGPLAFNWDAIIAAGPVTYSANDSTAASNTIVTFQIPGRYTFRVRANDTNGFFSTNTVSVTVSAGPMGMVVAPYETQVAAGQSVAFRADAWDQLGNQITVTPTWSVSGGGTIDSTGLFSASIPGGPYEVTAVADSLSATGTVWVLPSPVSSPPAITTQPVNQTVGVGSNASFTVAATGTAPLSYQWLFNSAPISGATASSFTLVNAQATNAGAYSVQVTNTAGSALSSNAFLKVLPVLTITAQNTNKVYGAPLPVFTPLYSGLVNGDTPASLQSQPVLTTPATAGSPVATYPINVSGASTNYLIIYGPGTLAVTPASTSGLLSSSTNPAPTGQPVVFTMALTAVPPGVGTPSGTVQFKVDGVNAGLPAALSAGSTAYSTSTLALGTHTVVAEYAGDGNFIGTTNSLSTNQLVNTLPNAVADTIERDPTNGVKVSIATLLSNDSDPDGDTITFLSVSASSAHGGTVVSDGTWVYYTPAAGFTNIDTFTYAISDRRGTPVTGTVIVNIRVDYGPSPNLTITDLGSNRYEIRGDGIPDRTYRIQYADDLNHTNWQDLGPATASPAGVFVLVDSAGSPQRFYRSVYP